MKQALKALRGRVRYGPLLRPDLSGQAAGDALAAAVESGRPLMAARFGRVELDAVLCLVDRSLAAGPEPFSRWRRKLLERLGRLQPAGWEPPLRQAMQNNAGFFPAEPAYLERFARRMLDDMPELDFLGSWLPGEARLRSRFPQARLVPLADLEPYYHPRPWTRVLAGRRVLVVHPFAESIRRQYTRRRELFANPQVLPEFDLQVLPAVQSIAGNRPPEVDWFAALERMCAQAAAREFDLAIIGAGAYGFPLAAFIKRLGRQAVHLGGATQILFGIRGRRWEALPFFAGLMNDAWVRPLPEETPPHAGEVEGGCYW